MFNKFKNAKGNVDNGDDFEGSAFDDEELPRMQKFPPKHKSPLAEPRDRRSLRKEREGKPFR